MSPEPAVARQFSDELFIQILEVGNAITVSLPLNRTQFLSFLKLLKN